jgi:hypothetical protein
VEKDFSIKSLLKGSTDFNYLPSFTPGNAVSTSPFAVRTADLFRQAGVLADRQEAAFLGTTAPLTASDYADLAEQHKALASAHEQLALEIKGAMPTMGLKAVSANGDAYGAHLDAAKRCLQSIAGTPEAIDFARDNRNQNSNTDRDSVIAPESIPAKDCWLGAHRAFVMSRMAHNEVLFATVQIIQ